MYIRDTIAVLEKLGLEEADREKIFGGNLRTLMRM
jgi:hypothetical protein